MRAPTYLDTDRQLICHSAWGEDESLRRIKRMYALGHLSLRQLEHWVAATMRHFAPPA